MHLTSVQFIVVLIFSICTFGEFRVENGYYWREYTGNIPSDAVIAGRDINGRSTFIGQVYVKNCGLMVGPIYPGELKVEVCYSGVKTIDKNIKILCGSQQNFHWLKANAKSLHVILTGKKAVIGGHDDYRGESINIGRISFLGDTKVSKINAFILGGASFYFPFKGSEKELKTYEVLVYDSGNKTDMYR